MRAPRHCRYAACAQLVSEQEVQALSIDAARSNVEAHFAYICGAFERFMQRYLALQAVHAGEAGRAGSSGRGWRGLAGVGVVV